ncbi:MAG: DUF423 domain-containing protein [Pseudomonadota bacterium]
MPPTTARLFLLTGALLGGLGVAFGAFGAHGLKKVLSPALLDIYHTAVLYQFLHVFALLAAGLWLRQSPEATGVGLAGWAWLGGILLFSGSLYLYVFSGVHWLAMVTPVGGVLFMIGWLAAAWAAARATPPREH